MEKLINGVNQRFEIDGPDGAPVITFAHALSLDLRSWNPQAAYFRDRYRVLRYDLRGHSHIDEGGGPFSIEDMADDVVGLLDHLDISSRRVGQVSEGLGTADVLGPAREDLVDRLDLAEV